MNENNANTNDKEYEEYLEKLAETEEGRFYYQSDVLDMLESQGPWF